MILVAGHLTIDPAHRAEALAAIDACVTPTRLEEGCLEYGYSAALGDENRLNLLERWESEEAMNAHLATEHLATFLGQIGDFLGGSVEVIRYDVATSSKLF